MDRLLVVNKALMKIGLPLAASLNDCDWNVQIVFESAAEEVLRSFAWGFAQKFVVLSGGLPPAHGFFNGANLPGDCCRVIDVHCAYDLRSPKARYIVSGRKLFTNVEPVNLRYVFRDYEPGNWPVDFADAVACRMAMEVAALSAQDSSKVPLLSQLYEAKLAAAQANDAREITERVPLDDSLWLSRIGNQGAAPRGRRG